MLDNGRALALGVVLATNVATRLGLQIGTKVLEARRIVFYIKGAEYKRIVYFQLTQDEHGACFKYTLARSKEVSDWRDIPWEDEGWREGCGLSKEELLKIEAQNDKIREENVKIREENSKRWKQWREEGEKEPKGGRFPMFLGTEPEMKEEIPLVKPKRPSGAAMDTRWSTYSQAKELFPTDPVVVNFNPCAVNNLTISTQPITQQVNDLYYRADNTLRLEAFFRNLFPDQFEQSYPPGLI